MVLSEPCANPPQVRTGHRVRSYHSKGRTGCITCKKRRIKCDERHPTCLKCENAKRTCEGYPTLQVWIFEPDKNRDIELPIKKPGILHPKEEWRSLQYFFERTGPALGLFNSPAAMFWRKVIPPLGQTNCAIRNQLIATAAAQEVYMKPEDTPGAKNLSARSYNKALGILARESNPSVQTLLISCLLSIALESVRHDYETVHLHLRSGLAVLREWKSDPNRKDTDKVIEYYLEPIFAQLEATLGLQYGDAASLIPLNQLTWTRPVIPKAFDSILAAREKFQEIGVHLFMLQQDEPDFESYINPKILDVLSLWDEWKGATTALRQNVKTERQVFQCKLLDLLVRGHRLPLIANANPHETAWDDHLEECRDVVRLAGEINNYNTGLAMSNDFLEPDFDVDPGIVPIMWQIVVSCRDPHTRRTALRLMRSHHHKCGHDDDCFIAAHAESIMVLEEEGLSVVLTAADIPEARRIRPVSVDFSTPGVMRATYTRSPYTVHETIETPCAIQQPRVQKFKLFPLSNTMRLAGYQGLIRPNAVGCRCKSFGGDLD